MTPSGGERASSGCQQWLENATKGLCDQAKERIAHETTAHYEHAVAALLEEGRDEAEAHAIAQAALGRPRRARRSFRTVHLTAREKSLIDALTNRPRSAPLWPVLAILGFSFWLPVLIFVVIYGATHDNLVFLGSLLLAGTVVLVALGMGSVKAYRLTRAILPIRAVPLFWALFDLVTLPFYAWIGSELVFEFLEPPVGPLSILFALLESLLWVGLAVLSLREARTQLRVWRMLKANPSLLRGVGEGPAGPLAGA